MQIGPTPAHHGTHEHVAPVGATEAFGAIERGKPAGYVQFGSMLASIVEGVGRVDDLVREVAQANSFLDRRRSGALCHV